MPGHLDSLHIQSKNSTLYFIYEIHQYNYTAHFTLSKRKGCLLIFVTCKSTFYNGANEAVFTMQCLHSFQSKIMLALLAAGTMFYCKPYLLEYSICQSFLKRKYICKKEVATVKYHFLCIISVLCEQWDYWNPFFMCSCGILCVHVKVLKYRQTTTILIAVKKNVP